MFGSAQIFYLLKLSERLCARYRDEQIWSKAIVVDLFRKLTRLWIEHFNKIIIKQNACVN